MKARRHPQIRPHQSADGVRIEKRSEEHTSELQSLCNLVCRLLLEKKEIHLAAPVFKAAPPSEGRTIHELKAVFKEFKSFSTAFSLSTVSLIFNNPPNEPSFNLISV